MILLHGSKSRNKNKKFLNNGVFFLEALQKKISINQFLQKQKMHSKD